MISQKIKLICFLIFSFLFFAILAISCHKMEPDTLVVKVAPYREAPVTEWQDFSGKERARLLEVLKDLQPSPGVSEADASAWVKGLAESLPEGAEWTLSLGTAPHNAVVEAGFYPFLIVSEKPSKVLTGRCLLTDGCATCENTVGTPGKTPKAPKKEYSGICATLSTAYSLVYVLGKRTELGPLGTQNHQIELENGERIVKKYWKKGFLSTIKEDQEHKPEVGTPRDKIKNAYVRYGCQCDEEVSIDDAGGDVDRWLRDLKAKVEDDDPNNCHLIIDGDNWAHDMHIDGIDENNQIGVSNTGIQGSGSGDDVPVVGGQQVWEITASQSGPNIDCKSSTGNGSVTYWNRKDPKEASYICCLCP